MLLLEVESQLHRWAIWGGAHSDNEEIATRNQQDSGRIRTPRCLDRKRRARGLTKPSLPCIYGAITPTTSVDSPPRPIVPQVTVRSVVHRAKTVNQELFAELGGMFGVRQVHAVAWRQLPKRWEDSAKLEVEVAVRFDKAVIDRSVVAFGSVVSVLKAVFTLRYQFSECWGARRATAAIGGLRSRQ